MDFCYEGKRGIESPKASNTSFYCVTWYLRIYSESGLAYKALNLKERLPQMSEEAQLQLLSSDGMLVKRPLLICEDKILVGFKEAEWSTIL